MYVKEIPTSYRRFVLQAWQVHHLRRMFFVWMSRFLKRHIPFCSDYITEICFILRNGTMASTALSQEAKTPPLHCVGFAWGVPGAQPKDMHLAWLVSPQHVTGYLSVGLSVPCDWLASYTLSTPALYHLTSIGGLNLNWWKTGWIVSLSQNSKYQRCELLTLVRLAVVYHHTPC